MKKGVKIILIIFIILFLIYLGIKIFLVVSYPKASEYPYIEDVKRAFNNKETVTIKKSNEQITDYVEYKDLKIRNDFSVSKENSQAYYLKGTSIPVFFIRNGLNSMAEFIEKENKSAGFWYNLKKDFDKNNIDTNFKLYEYLINNYTFETSIFKSINTIRRDYAIILSLNIAFPNYNKVTVINGDYNGYILEAEDIKIVKIEHGDYEYMIITDTEYPDSQLYDVISTIEFEDE